MTNKYTPFNLNGWVDENRHLLKPPVGAKTLFEESGSFMIFVVGGPNKRRDFHYNETEGEVFLLPAKVLHSPQRKADTVGLVVEVKRPGTQDAVYWYCDSCGNELYKATYQFDQIGTELNPVLEAVHGDEELRTCKDWDALVSKQ